MDHQVPLLDQISVNEATEYEIQEGRKVDYLIEIKETNGEDLSGSQSDKSAKQIFDEIFKDLNNRSTKSCTIFRVTVGLRESNPDAYKPKLISIGPYHNKNPDLRSIEKYKLMYLQRFLQRKEGIDVESCIRELEELKDETRKCYDGMEDLDSDNTGQFLQMLLLVVVVVEYILERCGMIPTGEDVIIEGGCIDNQVRRDLLLLENQLHFFVLTKLHDMTKEVDEIPFTIMVKCAFLPSFSKITPAPFLEAEETILRNLIAYEQQSPNMHPTYYSDYAIFMDHLVDLEKDVNLFRLKGIIRNRIGEDKEVAITFNKIGKGVDVSSDFYYKEGCRKVVQQCEKHGSERREI
ncbi:hypothetical protein RND71_010745 [Anisodus tanguticus]|uniref:Uncharacterized protein n=1 Tax=Anisodus tanguticus TaxID=243964 RepID=A0AAE1SKC3_9SOLA|nr:hypothetical protein RND71_010745 [Anisodus tanguticus]